MPKLVNHDERRVAIASAAARTIAEVGIDSTTMGDVARAAGCTVGALPHYFANKDEILIAALQHVHETVRVRAAQRALSSRLDPVEVWLAVLPINAEQRREWRVWLAFGGRAAYDEVLAAEFRARYAQGHQDTQLVLRAVQSTGALPRQLDLEAASESVTTMIDGLGLRATLESRTWPLARQREHVARHLTMLGYKPVRK